MVKAGAESPASGFLFGETPVSGKTPNLNNTKAKYGTTLDLGSHVESAWEESRRQLGFLGIEKAKEELANQ